MSAIKPNSSTALVTAAVMLAAALSLAGSVQYWNAESDYQHQSPDPYRIADQATRLADFRTAVPPDAILGYLTDVPADNTLNASMFFAAQYQLAPRLLQKDQSHDLVLGNFARPADFASLGQQHGLRIERDFGNGILLFRKEAKQ
jgi:hypothetical protein